MGIRIKLSGLLLLTVSAVGLLPPERANADAFVDTGFLNYVHAGHTATLLTNGTVLLIGGDSNRSIVERYDPATGTWTTNAPLKIGRSYHTATLLTNGLILVTGGLVIGGPSGPFVTNSCELFNPITGQWTNNGAMHIPRRNHAATLLPDGRVLVSGGRFSGNFNDGYFPTNCCELYNPNTGTWEFTGSMIGARTNHTPIVLSSGKVFVAGNAVLGGSVLSTNAELYDPITGVWTATSAMNFSHNNHATILLPNGKILVSGSGLNVATNVCEIFDPKTETWTPTGSMIIKRFQHLATTLPNGKVLVIGGLLNNPTNNAEIYDPATGEWALIDSAGTNELIYHTVTALPNGNVLVAGGIEVASHYTDLSNAVLYTSSNITVVPINLQGVTQTVDSAFQFGFTNTPDVSFIAYGATNLSTPMNDWTVLSGPVEISPGVYQFTDPEMAANPQRFYRIRSP